MSNAEEKLRKLINEIAIKENYEEGNIDIKPITSGGANYSSSLYLATISKTKQPDLHLFAKVACLGEEFRADAPTVTLGYLAEGIFYDELIPAYQKIYNKYNVDQNNRLRTPKYYAHVLTPYEETMIMENLDVQGFKNFDRMKIYTWEYASTAVTELAKFHAIGHALKEENPTEFEKLVKPLENNGISDIQVLKSFAIAIQNTCKFLDDEYKRKLEKFSDVDWVVKLLADMMESKMVLVHGDFRPSNLMHRRRNGKLEVITLDYQTLRIGNPLLDLMYFMFIGSDEEFRRLHYRRLLDHYFTQLTLALKQLQLDVENVYSKKTFEEDLKQYQSYGLLISLALTALVVVDPDEAPVFTDMTSFQVKPNQLALKRIHGVVRDFIRWGAI